MPAVELWANKKYRRPNQNPRSKYKQRPLKQELMNKWTPGYCCNFLPKIMKEKHIFEQDEGGLFQIIHLTPLWVIFIPSVNFEPLCTFNFTQNIRKKIRLSLLSKQSILGHFGFLIKQHFSGKIALCHF